MIFSFKYNKAKGQLLFCLVFFIPFTSCVNDMKEVSAIVEAINLPAAEETNAHLLFTDSAQTKVKVDAPRLLHFTGDDPYMELPKGVHVWFYNKDGSVESELSANYAISYEKKDVMIAENDVMVVNTRGEKLNTEELSWSKKDHRIFTEEFVTITTEDEVIYGHGLESNEDFSKYQIKNISGTIAIENEQDL